MQQLASSSPSLISSSWRVLVLWVVIGLTLIGLTFLGGHLTAAAQYAVTQTNTQQIWDKGFQNLVYGGSTTIDVQHAVGEPPDQIIRSQTMYPVIENYYYFDNNGSNAATVFVFENGLLVGLHYKSPQNQYIDLTYVLANNGDRQLNRQLRGGMRGYFPYFPFYSW